MAISSGDAVYPRQGVGEAAQDAGGQPAGFAASVAEPGLAVPEPCSRRCLRWWDALDHVLLYDGLSPVVEFNAEQYGAGLVLSGHGPLRLPVVAGARVDHDGGCLDELAWYCPVQDQVVDAVPVSALGFALFDQDAGPAGRAWGEGLPVSVDDGDAVLGILFRFLHLSFGCPNYGAGSLGLLRSPCRCLGMGDGRGRHGPAGWAVAVVSHRRRTLGSAVRLAVNILTEFTAGSQPWRARGW